MRAFLAIAVVASACVSEQSQTPASSCEPIGRSQFLPAVPEASGIGYAGGVLWTHNDSDTPVLYRIDRSGRAAPVTVAGADVRDWEDLASAPCAAAANASADETCLYIADIGDNQESRDRITIYEIPVPSADNMSTKPATSILARYPDRPHDAEALLITRSGTFIITKENPARVYQFPARLNPGETVALALLLTLNEKSRITGAASSPDGRWVALRSNRTLFVYAIDTFLKGGDPIRVDLTSFKEPQGEGVAFASGGDLYLVSEGGGKNAAGMLTRLHCAFLR